MYLLWLISVSYNTILFSIELSMRYNFVVKIVFIMLKKILYVNFEHVEN